MKTVKKLSVIALSIILIIVIFSGVTYNQAGNVKVDIDVQDNGTIYIVINNPTSFNYELEEFKAEIYIGNMAVATVSLPNPINVPAGKTVRAPADVKINIVSALLAALSGGDEWASVYYKLVPKLGPISLLAHETSKNETVDW